MKLRQEDAAAQSPLPLEAPGQAPMQFGDIHCDRFMDIHDNTNVYINNHYGTSQPPPELLPASSVGEGVENSSPPTLQICSQVSSPTGEVGRGSQLEIKQVRAMLDNLKAARILDADYRPKEGIVKWKQRVVAETVHEKFALKHHWQFFAWLWKMNAESLRKATNPTNTASYDEWKEKIKKIISCDNNLQVIELGLTM